MEHKCQLPHLDKETGEVTQCEATDIEIFTYQGNDFYFCPEHYKLFSENIDALYETMQKEFEESQNVFTQEDLL